MDTWITYNSFYLRGKVRDLLPWLRQFDLNMPVAEFTRLHLN